MTIREYFSALVSLLEIPIIQKGLMFNFVLMIAVKLVRVFLFIPEPLGGEFSDDGSAGMSDNPRWCDEEYHSNSYHAE